MPRSGQARGDGVKIFVCGSASAGFQEPGGCEGSVEMDLDRNLAARIGRNRKGSVGILSSSLGRGKGLAIALVVFPFICVKHLSPSRPLVMSPVDTMH